MEPDPKRRHRKTITLSTVVSMLAICGVVLPVFGVLATPWFVDFVTDAVAGDIREEVQDQVAPMTAGLKVLIEDTIAELEDDISALEFRRDNVPETSWTAADAQVLTNKRRRLASQRMALSAIVRAERTGSDDD